MKTVAFDDEQVMTMREIAEKIAPRLGWRTFDVSPRSGLRPVDTTPPGRPFLRSENVRRTAVAIRGGLRHDVKRKTNKENDMKTNTKKGKSGLDGKVRRWMLRVHPEEREMIGDFSATVTWRELARRMLAGGRTMSRFNTDTICMACAEAERRRPDYGAAVEAERAAIASGDRDFKGIGL